MAELIPWPSDAIMLVCASPAGARREFMESVNDGRCRHCDAAIVYDGRSMRRASEIAKRSGSRPVKFFCLPCSELHDVTQCNRVIDHTGGRSIEVFDQKGANL